ncbi:unnamed protein product [Rhizophagus irregularis]|nr:unnamed protein product [Rhizophagus irregularis]
MEEDKKILSHDIKEMNKYIHDIEGGIANEVSGINAKLDDITQWNLAWQKKLLSKNEDIIADATIPMNEFSDPSEMVKRANFTLSRGFRDFSTHVKATIDNVRWMAPEKLKDHNNPYTAKCEIYSFGMVLWEIAEGKLPFQRENDIVQIRNLVVNQKYRPSFSLGVPNEWVKIAYQAMQDSPSARPSLKDIFMTLNDVYQIHKPKKTPTSSPICSPSQSDLPDPDDLELSLDLSVIDIDTLSIKEAIAEHKKNGDRLKAWKAFCQHSELDDMLAKYWKGYYLYYDLCPIEDPEDKNAKQLRVKQSVEYFKEAADFGLADAQLRYGHCLWSGEAIKRDIKESIRYFQMSADNGNHTAMYNIGNILYNGIGANKDEEKGSNYLRLAALSGQPKAIAMCKTKGIKLA